MKKRMITLGLITAISALFLTGCCDHEWVDATCGTPKTCSKCGETEGEPTGDHTWVDATCTEPKTCSVCGETEGEALGHDWEAATCTEPETCSVCGETEGKALGHDWKAATCTEPKTCSVCGKTKGEALGHTVDEWNVTKEATCAEEGEETGECSVCKKNVTLTIDKTEHTPGDWVVTKEAGVDIAGTRTRSCTVCGAELETEEYELTEEEREAAFKASCQSLSYDEIARDPDSYILQPAVYTGKVVQVMEDDDGSAYRVNITPTSWGGYDDTIYVEASNKALERLGSRVLEDDIITVWGYNFSTVSYTTVMGAKLTIPAVLGEYIEVTG